MTKRYDIDSPKWRFCARLLAQMFNLAMANDPRAIDFLLSERAKTLATAIGMAPQVLQLFTPKATNQQFKLPGL